MRVLDKIRRLFSTPMSADQKDALLSFIDVRITLVNKSISNCKGVLRSTRIHELHRTRNKLYKYRSKVSKGFFLTPTQYNFVYFQGCNLESKISSILEKLEK